jgi:hypothetical protein
MQGVTIMRQPTDFAWSAARKSYDPLRWVLVVAGALALVMYLRLGEFRDPSVAVAPPPQSELPARKPPSIPIPLDILNAPPSEVPAPAAAARPDRGAATYDDLRRELLTTNKSEHWYLERRSQ